MAIEDENPLLNQAAEQDTELKNWLIDYVGDKEQPENGEVTVGMILNTVAVEFPEFVLAVAEENFIRGYKQALDDADSARDLLEQEKNSLENESE